MPSPFPGMDPYLEGPNIWEDFHASLAVAIRRQLLPRLRPKYFPVLVPRVTVDEIQLEHKPYAAKPDVAVIRSGTGQELLTRGEQSAIAPPPLVGQLLLEEEIRLYSIEISEVATGNLVTAIEILSPVNKRSTHEAFEVHKRKRRDLLRAGAHFMEIDLLRAGQRPLLRTPLPPNVPYFVFLYRQERLPHVGIWPVHFREPVPLVPVPLKAPDPDVPLDLTQAIREVYDEAGYDLRIDYTQPPPKPDLPPDDAAWLESHLRSIGVRRLL